MTKDARLSELALSLYLRHQRHVLLAYGLEISLPATGELATCTGLNQTHGHHTARHEYTEDASSCKRSPTPIYTGRLGGYFTGNLASHFNGDKSEAQIDLETKRLMKLLKACDKYQKYRDRQPSDTTSAKDNKEQRWPDHLEEAFFRALVRWPPMGRRKQMLDGQLRGRNELVADSIHRDTGEPRTRKQVSSHIQVLKPMLSDQPQILVYMSTEDMGGRGGRGRHGSHFGHHRHRHASSKYDHSQADTDLQQSLGYLPSSVALAKLLSGHEESPYTVANFDMFVEVAKRHAHDFTQLSNSKARLDDLHITDTNSWHKQYPEFKFHRTEHFRDHHVLICDATIKVMTMERLAGATLSITFDLRSQDDLSVYDSIECRTRFFENGRVADQPDGDRAQGKARETRTQEEYHAEHGLMHVHFGSKFWVHQMQKLGDLLGKASAQEEQPARTRYEELVRRELQNMTAAQDIYGIKDGEQVRLLTILWRFSQTRYSHEAGRMTWRVANFGHRREKKWMKDEELSHIRNAKELHPSHTSSSLSMLSIPTSSHSMYPTLPLDFNHPFGNTQPQIDLDALDALASTDFSNSNSATAPSLANDYSQTHSLPSLTHSQDTSGVPQQPGSYPDANDFDFDGGHITISGCLAPLEPAIHLGTYDSYAPNVNGMHHHNNTLPNLSSITGLESQHTLPENAFGDLASLAHISTAGMPGGCYATKPSWHHPSLISQLENAAEQFGMPDMLPEDGNHGGLMGMGFVEIAVGVGFAEDTGLVRKGWGGGIVRWDRGCRWILGERERRLEGMKIIVC
ncbi:uncharacterized protein N0V89_002168 [Didymosphaeria variabile]|uniref:TEA domain-containing protein n=1 Tax=Didymosphaeria variabile TaxID=1932322 RepID=A0A9W9CE41_9PLEO|nr:uncharacterized protein N0V89_002168 [Didymosphaeria variabile]KAJ4357592.1 hypothetical protein N0V89_002168 [Didymosphaeria variabile]